MSTLDFTAIVQMIASVVNVVIVAKLAMITGRYAHDTKAMALEMRRQVNLQRRQMESELNSRLAPIRVALAETKYSIDKNRTAIATVQQEDHVGLIAFSDAPSSLREAMDLALRMSPHLYDALDRLRDTFEKMPRPIGASNVETCQNALAWMDIALKSAEGAVDVLVYGLENA